MAAIITMDEMALWPRMLLRWQGRPSAEMPRSAARDARPTWKRPAFRWSCQADARPMRVALVRAAAESD